MLETMKPCNPGWKGFVLTSRPFSVIKYINTASWILGQMFNS